MKILHFGSVSENKASGLSFSIPNLIKSQNYAEKEKIAFLYNTIESIKIKKSDLLNYDIIVLHSFFILDYLRVLLIMPKETKLIICPRGAFSKSNKYVSKKHIYAFIYYSIIKLRRINYSIHFLTENEMNRSRFRSKNDFVVGNSIDIKSSHIGSDKLLEYKFKSKKIVYIGRFSNHIKGLDKLFDLILENKDLIERNNIKLEFYGPHSKDKELLFNFVEKNKILNVDFKDAIYDEKKNEVLKNSSFHILSSRSEGFPMSVLESAAYFTPQILSLGTNLQETMIDNNFGVPFNKDMFSVINQLTFKDYKELALNVRAFAEEHSHKKIGRITNKAYQQ